MSLSYMHHDYWYICICKKIFYQNPQNICHQLIKEMNVISFEYIKGYIYKGVLLDLMGILGIISYMKYNKISMKK